jgi:hypothetical protein
VVATGLSDDVARARAELAGYAAAGAERVILAPAGAGWERGYQFAADVQAAAGSPASHAGAGR